MKKYGRRYFIRWLLIISSVLWVSICETTSDDTVKPALATAAPNPIAANKSSVIDVGDPGVQSEGTNSKVEDEGDKQGVIVGDKQGVIVGDKQGGIVGDKQGVIVGDTKVETEGKILPTVDTTVRMESPEVDNGDELVDTPQIVNDETIGEESYYQVHTIRLMLYIITPVGALVIIYFVMRAVKGNSRHFFNRYQIVGARADNIELRPLGYESDEEDIVFDASSRN